MVAIFSYEFPVAVEHFKQEKVKLLTLSNYTAMLDAAVKTNYIRESDVKTLELWREDPANWVPSNANDN